ncbi:hypothetical protein AOLI_G00209760 [Acnodon oligacanthus]
MREGVEAGGVEEMAESDEAWDEAVDERTAGLGEQGVVGDGHEVEGLGRLVWKRRLDVVRWRKGLGKRHKQVVRNDGNMGVLRFPLC